MATSVGRDKSLDDWTMVIPENIQSVQTLLTQEKESLKNIQREIKPLMKRSEILSYHVNFIFFTSSFLLDQVEVLPFPLNILGIVLPLIFFIGDVFINIFHFSIGNFYITFFNCFLAHPLNEIEEIKKQSLLHEVLIHKTNIKTLNERIVNYTKSQECVIQKIKNEKDLDKSTTIQTKIVQDYEKKLHEPLRILNSFEQQKKALQDDLNKYQRQGVISRTLTKIGDYFRKKPLSEIARDTASALNTLNKDYEQFKEQNKEIIDFLSNHLIKSENGIFNLAKLKETK